MESCQFNENTNPAEAYASSTASQGSAVVVTNTGVSDVSACHEHDDCCTKLVSPLLQRSVVASGTEAERA